MAFKQVIVIRTDLGMGKGKAIAHACHASLDAALKADEKVMKDWQKEGAKKIVVKVNSLKEMQEVQKKATKEKILNVMIKDAGLTQLKKGTATVLAIGPAKEKTVDKITGKLKLY